MPSSRPRDDVLDHIEMVLQTSTYDDTASNGLLVRGRSSVRSIGAALNTSLATINAAIASGVDCLFVHHAPWASIDLDLHPVKLDHLRAAGISLYAAHEALDRATTNSAGPCLSPP